MDHLEKLSSKAAISFVGFVESCETSESEPITFHVMNIPEKPKAAMPSSFKMEVEETRKTGNTKCAGLSCTTSCTFGVPCLLKPDFHSMYFTHPCRNFRPQKIFRQRTAIGLFFAPWNPSTHTCLGECLPGTTVSLIRFRNLGFELFF